MQLLATRQGDCWLLHTPVHTRLLRLQEVVLFPTHSSSEAPTTRAPALQARKLKTRGRRISPGYTASRQAELGGPQSRPTVPQPYSLPFDLHKMLHFLTLSLSLLPHSLTHPPLSSHCYFPWAILAEDLGPCRYH